MVDSTMSEHELLQLIPDYEKQFLNNDFPHILLNTDLKVVVCNSAFLELSGHTYTGVTGKTLAELGITSSTLNNPIDLDELVSQRKPMIVRFSTPDTLLVATVLCENILSNDQQTIAYICKINVLATDLSTETDVAKPQNDDTSEMLHHELKNAISSVNLLVNGLGRFTKPGGEKYLIRLDSQLERIRALLEPPEQVTQNIVLHDVLKDIIEINTDIANDKGLDFVYVNTAQDATVKGTHHQFFTIMSNLVNNAIKYTIVGEVIVIVSQSKSTSSIKVVIRDTGIGIPPHEREKVFSPHYRAENAVQIGMEGQGLGLALVLKTVTDLGGDIDMYSDQDVGSIITLVLNL